MKKSTETTNIQSTKNTNKVTERLTFLREDILKMSQKEFSDVIGISQTYLSMIENRKKPINTELLHKICSTLNVNPDWLMAGTGGKKNIFLSKSKSGSVAVQFLRDEALSNLKSAYSLKENEMLFINKFLSLSSKERSAVIHAVEILKGSF